MTTIACDGKIMVSDSQSTDGNNIYVGYQKKIYDVGYGLVFASCGTTEDSIQVSNWMKQGADPQGKPHVHEHFTALILEKETGIVKMLGSKLVLMEVSAPVFIGSGYELAMGAYEACGDLVKSVGIACKFDTCSGGEIQTSYEVKGG